jgi:hypothetical protein
MGLFNTTRNGNPKTARYFKAELSRARGDRTKLIARLPESGATTRGRDRRAAKLFDGREPERLRRPARQGPRGGRSR